MTMTPEQLRELLEDLEITGTDAAANRWLEICEVVRAHVDALEELAGLRSRLEIDFVTDGNGKRVPFPEGAPDGIACRDETIRLLEAALAESERKCERLKFHAEAMAKGMLDDGPANLWAAYDAYRAEFKEES